MAIPPWLASVLTRYSIPYEVCAPPVPPAAGRAARTEFLACHGRPVAVVLPAAARLDLERVKEVVDRDGLRPAFEAEIAAWFKGCHPNRVPPLRLRSDLTILMDRSLASLGTVLFPAGTPEASVRLRFRDWYRAVRPGVGRFTIPAGQADRPANPAPILVVQHIVQGFIGGLRESLARSTKLSANRGRGAYWARSASRQGRLDSPGSPSDILWGQHYLPEVNPFGISFRL